MKKKKAAAKNKRRKTPARAGKSGDGPAVRHYLIIGAVTIAALVGLHFAINACFRSLSDSGVLAKIRDFRIKTGKEAIPKIHVQEAYGLFKKNKTLFVDARSEVEYNESHIKGAISIPAGSSPEKIAGHAEKLKGKTLITYCHGVGCHLSDKTANALYDAGYRRIKNFFGGWNEWTKAGYPVEKYEPPERYKRLFGEPVTAGSIQEASLEEVKYLYDLGLAHIIDADTPAKYNERHIDKAMHVPPENTDAVIRNYLVMFVQKILIVYCASGDERAYAVARKIYGFGAKKIFVYKGGLDAWEKAGYPLYKKQ